MRMNRAAASQYMKMQDEIIANSGEGTIFENILRINEDMCKRLKLRVNVAIPRFINDEDLLLLQEARLAQ